jgi:polyphosphate glucokinase
MEVLGVDIGGSGIKGAPVDTVKGVMTTERFRIPTPQPSAPEAVAETVAEIARHFDWQGPIGCTFPAIIKNGVMWSAANVDDAWIGTDGRSLLAEKTGCPVNVLNDGDAAGIAEMRFGAGKGHDGVVMIFTLGTGIGSAIFVDGKLVPNTELGHVELQGKKAERRVADSARKRKELTWEKWANRVSDYLKHMEALFSPDLIILGGGVAKKHDRFFQFLETQADVVPARLLNDAGIVGAAIAASELSVK